jgi:cytochrome c556
LNNPRWLAAAAAIALAVACPAVARAQENAVPPAKDTIFARKILMNAIDGNMDELETMLAPGGKLESAEGREHADNISILLMAFPHLFPPATNQWKQDAKRDPATDTYAAPALWADFADFYQRAAKASKIAYDAAHATRADEFRSLIAQLRAACNGCHAAYQKTD